MKMRLTDKFAELLSQGYSRNECCERLGISRASGDKCYGVILKELGWQAGREIRW